MSKSIKRTMETVSISMAITSIALAMAACGKPVVSAPAAGGGGGGSVPTTNVTLQSNALAGPAAASTWRPGFKLALLDLLWGFKTAHAAVSSFAAFSACNDTLILLDNNGNQITVNGTATPSVGQGLLTFSNTSTNPMNIGSIAIPTGTVISEIDITFAVKPSVCGGANYAVEFNDGTHGVINITQNTAFKFKFPAGGTQILGAAQTVDLKFGAIVNGMATLGAALNNVSIQTVNVGQAQ